MSPLFEDVKDQRLDKLWELSCYGIGEAFDELMNELYPDIYRLCYAVAKRHLRGKGKHEDYEDIVAEVLLNLWHKLSRSPYLVCHPLPANPP